ncbi:hypothetical protein MIND_01241400 [Mycena indigotica]|uniref:Uncharacterized protein n=1 Tax=Mycena indigotica TaxID=2126181 RepID=A0A8H6S3C0_9AGAR|nr:uncharacterized protein MIND_01241400 [Mycena indigotica]KAF7292144.1 hypothetical protein MIND_01241400 [Mycena indigotica]
MALRNVSVLFAMLLNLALGSVLYGIYILLFLVSTYLFVHSRQVPSPRHGTASWGSRASRTVMALKSPIFVSSLVLWLGITTTWTVTVYDSFQAFVLYHDGLNADGYFHRFSRTSGIVKNTAIALSLAIGDAMIIYRLSVVWPNRKILSLAVLSFVGLLISLIATIVNVTKIQSTSRNVGSYDLGIIQAFSIIFPVFSVVTPVYCTALISYRMYTVGSAAGDHIVDERSLSYFAIILVESSVLYT